jgi:hypothetical protein
MKDQQVRVAWIVLFGIALVLRLSLLERQGLWVDEVFSLAVATGHSIEQAPAISRPELGDFVEPRAAVPPAELRRYLQHDDPPAGPYRVVRAVFISDTSPPFYYLLLWAWTLAAGTSDAALRLFSALLSLATLPLLRSLGREMLGERGALVACAFFAVAPVGLETGIEGRMYALTILLGALLAWTSLALARRGGPPALVLLWIATAAAGFLTHYFFAFAWFACTLWLLLAPGRLDRRFPVAMSVGVGLLTAPWFIRLPEILGHWRVAKGWLDGSVPLARRFMAPFDLAAGIFSLPESLAASIAKRAPLLAILLGLTVAAFAAFRLLRRREWGARDLPGLWIAASCLGPLVFDQICHSRCETISRYAWPALPAAALLVGMIAMRLAARPRRFAAVAFCLLWLPGYWREIRPVGRNGDAFREAGALLRQRTQPGEVVIVQSIPSGVLGLARYLGDGPPVASWVEQLGNRRVPVDTEILTSGEPRVVLVEDHDLDAPAPEEDWLRQNARLVDAQRLSHAQLFFFELEPRRDSTRIARGAAPGDPAALNNSTSPAEAAGD